MSVVVVAVVLGVVGPAAPSDVAPANNSSSCCISAVICLTSTISCALSSMVILVAW